MSESEHEAACPRPSASMPEKARGIAYDGPLTSSAYDFAGQRVQLVRPADPDRMLEDPAVHDWNRQDDYMPYWAYLWPGALLLADAVAREPWPSTASGGSPLRALEIGCGIGLAGLVALGRGLSVCFSDYDASALGFAARNARENGHDRSRFSTRILDWRRPPDESYPVILGSDVLYERKLVPLVAELLSRMLSPGGLGLIACPGRTSAEGFPAEAVARGLDCRARPVTMTAEGQDLRGLIYRVTAPGHDPA